MTSSPSEFFALVNAYVTGPMEEAGYGFIGEYDEVTAGYRGEPLVSAPLDWDPSQLEPSPSVLPDEASSKDTMPRERVLSVGYEGPDEHIEKWIFFYPETNELDLGDWRETPSGQTPWDARDDPSVTPAEELERRLRVFGETLAETSSE